MSAGGDSAGVDIRSIIQLLLRDSGSEIVVLNSHIFVENYLRCSVFLLSPPQPLPCKCVQQNTPPWPSMRVCQVCRGIRRRSSSVKLCRRMLLSAMLGISRRRTEGRCRTVRKLIRCEVLPTLAIVRPELVRTVRTSAESAQWGQKGSSCMEINFAPVAVQVAATKLTIKFGCVLCENIELQTIYRFSHRFSQSQRRPRLRPSPSPGAN